MIDTKKLTDREIAILTYSLERFVDGMYSENIIDKEFERMAKEWLDTVRKEYRKRNIHWSEYFAE